jgi:hypothetical protein
MAASIAFVGNSNNIEVNGLRSDLESKFLNDATITVTIKDASGQPVSGEVWPQTMSYVPGTDGNYVLGLTRFLEMNSGAKYTAYIDANASDETSERVAHWEFAFTAQKRTK